MKAHYILLFWISDTVLLYTDYIRMIYSNILIDIGNAIFRDRYM